MADTRDDNDIYGVVIATFTRDEANATVAALQGHINLLGDARLAIVEALNDDDA